MITSDDHPPPDPSSSSSDYRNRQQTSNDLNINSDDKPLATVSNIDLLKSLLAYLDDANNPLPSFSIRDYAFSSRSKDIACNWPFSCKSLQICLQHGVKNLLPPFQSPDTLKNNNSSGSRCTVENRPPGEEVVSSFNGKPIDDQFVSTVACYVDKSKAELASESVNKNSSGSKEDLAQTKSKKAPLVSSQKTENQTAVKRCRVVAKLNSAVEPVEEVTVTPNNFIISETMASKVCPVCKTFSSSSNTTLNAHIDQCLSGESSMKWTANPKVIVKHRIKPRKTRLMVDIYKTAPRCTVEELDARNGTSWANNSRFPAQELEIQGEEERRMPTVISKVADHEGAVYIDTDGTKVRILSVPKVGTSDDHGAQKLPKKKKHNNHEHKHQHKYLKLSPNSKKMCSPKSHHGASEVTTGREENVAIEESCIKEDQGKQPQVHMKVDDLPIMRPSWACSKRTGLAKKFTKKLSVASDKSSEPGLRPPPSSGWSRLITKPVSKNLRKEASLLHGTSEDPSNAGPSKHLSREGASKFNLKRKFSALKRSCHHRLSKEDTILGPSKQQSRVEEDTSEKMSSDRMNLLEVRKKEKENSVASKSSSARLETGSVDPLRDLESVRKETRSHGTMQAPRGIDVLNPDNIFDSRECIQLYQGDQLRSPKHAEDVKGMFCADFTKESMHIDGVTDDIESQQIYFQEVDPIPIPGPPGSFLPSPGGDMVSDQELQGNSSLTRVQSTEDQHHHDLMDRDSMSDSPISTISDPSLARSDSDKFSVKSISLKDNNTRGFSGVMVDPINEKYDPFASSANAGDNWRSVHMTGFKNDQPCCCSRKEGAVASNYQESTLSRKCGLESLSLNLRPDMFYLSNYPTSSSTPETVISPPIMKLRVYSECDSAGSPSIPVLRLMGKNLTVVKTDEDASSAQQFSPSPQFPNVKNEYNSSSNSYGPIIFSQNQYGSRPIHALDTKRYDDGSPHVGAMIPQGRKRLDGEMANGGNMKEIIIIEDSPEEDMRRNWAASTHMHDNGSFQSCGNVGKWNCAAAAAGGGSSRSLGSPSASTSHLRSCSSTVYYPPSFS